MYTKYSGKEWRCMAERGEGRQGTEGKFIFTKQQNNKQVIGNGTNIEKS